MLINGFSVLGIAFFLGFTVINYLLGDYIVAGIYSFFIIILATNLIYLRKTKNIEIASELSVALTFVALIYIFVHGGTFETGIFWTFSFIPITFFLVGLYQGMIVSFLFLGVIFFAKLVQDLGFIDLAYDSNYISFFLIAQAFIFVLILFWSVVTERDEALLKATNSRQKKLNSKLTSTVDQLEEKQKKQDQLIEAFDKSIIEVQKKNKVLEDQSNQIKKEKAKDEALLSSLGEGMLATDIEGKIVVFNRQGENILGFNTKDVVGKDFHDIIKVFDENGRPLKSYSYDEAREKGRVVTKNDVQYQTKDGKLVPVAVTAAPIKIGGKSNGVVTVFRDVTEQRAIDRAKTEFVSLASHQLRTPLSATNWYVEMLLAGDAGKISKNQKEYLEQIHKGNQRLVALVNSLLNVSRIELGTFMVEPVNVSLAATAKDVIDELTGIIKKKHLKVKAVFSKSVPKIKADPNLIRIIFQNLLSNAVKYTPDKGSIDISIRKKAEEAVIKVKDTGIGIPKNQVGKIFDKLFRADNVLKTDTDGTGLGLYIVKQILSENDGNISVKSELGKGSEFTVSIPLSGMKKRLGNNKLIQMH